MPDDPTSEAVASVASDLVPLVWWYGARDSSFKVRDSLPYYARYNIASCLLGNGTGEGSAQLMSLVGRDRCDGLIGHPWGVEDRNAGWRHTARYGWAAHRSVESSWDLEGGEICDGKDDDGDGSVDEGFDLDRDAFNCGACGHVCDFVAGESCAGGSCRK